jgi:hypothetical protein
MIYLDPNNPRFIGSVAVYYDPNQAMAPGNYLPGRCAIWGSLFIVGDLQLIEKLTGKLPKDAGI